MYIERSHLTSAVLSRGFPRWLPYSWRRCNSRVAGDTLYMGDYRGGLRVLDISGELRGDLLRQGHEMTHVVTGDGNGAVPNAPSARGAIYRNGLVYVPDSNSGLWIVKVESKSELIL